MKIRAVINVYENLMGFLGKKSFNILHILYRNYMYKNLIFKFIYILKTNID